ncbi:MAG TPA: hypothetical protein PLB45_03885 [Bacilli bacterium]|jgi:hypothetical protein|nr:hypothetical protein [Bacilli bacterium]HPZ23953.1 hypothetical protein [Bacilli bacterium]HQC83993.1 hypothetical protein [Bacilli bacterium]
MNEGKELLYTIIDYTKDKYNGVSNKTVMCDGVDLVNLSKKLDDNIDNLSDVSNDLIDKVIQDNAYNSNELFRKKLIQLRDLLIGKKNYNLKVNINNEYKELIKQFKELINNIINNNVPGVFMVDSINESCNKLKYALKNYEVINNYEFIQYIVKEYDPVNYDNNMVTIMEYIVKHNLDILNRADQLKDKEDIKYVKKVKIDEEVEEILDNMHIKVRHLSNSLVGSLKLAKKNDIIDNYNLIKNNKVEDYGILHLIDDNNELGKLVLLLYASDESIKGVVDALKDNNGTPDVKSLRNIITTILPAFLSRGNEFYEPKYYDFISNIELLKKLDVNISSLINRDPLFLITNSEVIKYTLNYVEKLGANKRNIINRCYKTISIDASLLIQNVDILKKYKFDLKKMFNDDSYNYALLKVSMLELKLKYVISKYNLDVDNLDYNEVSNIILNKVSNEVNDELVVWGEN